MMGGFLLGYHMLIKAAEVSANLVYMQHRFKLKAIFITVELSLLTKTLLAIVNLTNGGDIIFQQLSSIIQKLCVIIPSVIYSIWQDSKEDCLICFSRFPETVLFSRYQERKEANCIATQTLKKTADHVI